MDAFLYITEISSFPQSKSYASTWQMRMYEWMKENKLSYDTPLSTIEIVIREEYPTIYDDPPVDYTTPAPSIQVEPRAVLRAFIGEWYTYQALQKGIIVTDATLKNAKSFTRTKYLVGKETVHLPILGLVPSTPLKEEEKKAHIHTNHEYTQDRTHYYQSVRSWLKVSAHPIFEMCPITLTDAQIQITDPLSAVYMPLPDDPSTSPLLQLTGEALRMKQSLETVNLDDTKLISQYDQKAQHAYQHAQTQYLLARSNFERSLTNIAYAEQQRITRQHQLHQCRLDTVCLNQIQAAVNGYPSIFASASIFVQQLKSVQQWTNNFMRSLEFNEKGDTELTYDVRTWDTVIIATVDELRWRYIINNCIHPLRNKRTQLFSAWNPQDINSRLSEERMTKYIPFVEELSRPQPVVLDANWTRYVQSVVNMYHQYVTVTLPASEKEAYSEKERLKLPFTEMFGITQPFSLVNYKRLRTFVEEHSAIIRQRLHDTIFPSFTVSDATKQVYLTLDRKQPIAPLLFLDLVALFVVALS